MTKPEVLAQSIIDKLEQEKTEKLNKLDEQRRTEISHIEANYRGRAFSIEQYYDEKIKEAGGKT
jgi:ABC-type Zn uptake system ZnuABC Zn-binding protein ZnuA